MMSKMSANCTAGVAAVAIGSSVATIALGYLYCRMRHGCKSCSKDSKQEEEETAGKVRSTTASGSTVYESSRAVDEYLFFHYGDGQDLLPYSFGPTNALDFPTRCANLGIRVANESGAEPTRALDLGCAVGRTSFDLARTFSEVVGLDFSHAFIKAANSMKTGSLDYTVQVEGDKFMPRTATAPADVDASRITFMQGDACNLPTDLGKFNLIIGCNLLCRLPDPSKLLERLPELLAPNGVVVFVSPYSWLEEYTPKDKWLGGTNGVASRDGLPAKVPKSLTRLAYDEDMPFLIREHVRKFQWGVSHVTAWQLKA